MAAYYNENDPFAAQWLRNLIERGLIAKGQVDDRSIEEVTPGDLAGFTQCHFFAGLGGWSCALRLAGWDDARPVWTGSAPCQPFSQAGARAGDADQRHLWPTWARLVRQCRPGCILGEQIASIDGLAWLDLVFADLEDADYAVAAADLCAAGVGAPHMRQRLYWVACAGAGLVGNAGHERLAWGLGHARIPREQTGADPRQTFIGAGLYAGNVADADELTCRQGGSDERRWHPGGAAQSRPGSGGRVGAGFWEACDWIDCRDGKRRPVEPGTFPLAHGVQARVGRLRAYGNAIVPQVAAAFVGAYLEVIDEALA